MGLKAGQLEIDNSIVEVRRAEGDTARRTGLYIVGVLRLRLNPDEARGLAVQLLLAAGYDVLQADTYPPHIEAHPHREGS